MCSDAGHQSSLEPKVAGVIEIGNQYFPLDQSLTWQPIVWTSTKSEDPDYNKYSLYSLYTATKGQVSPQTNPAHFISNEDKQESFNCFRSFFGCWSCRFTNL